MDLRLVPVINLHLDVSALPVDDEASIHTGHAGFFQIQAPLLQNPCGIGLEDDSGADLVCG